jgi:serine phosphatase RsbU (regulator of sigma subunit)
MSLRTRLVVAFFALSVVPLGAVTYYSYRTSVDALRDAAEREADLLAGELSQRMQLVTTQLSERVEHLMDMAELQAEMEQQVAQARTAAAATTPAAAPEAATTAAITDQVARSLGEAAMLLNTIELTGLRFGGRGGPNASRSGGSGRGGSGGRSPGQDPPRGRPAPPPPPTGAVAAVPVTPVPPQTQQVSPPPAPGAPRAPGAPPTPDAPAGNRLMVDLQPVRREMYRQILGDQRLDTLTPEQRQRIAEEVNQRMLGIVQGIKIGAVELQKQAEQASKDAEARSQAAAKAAEAAQVTSALSSAAPRPGDQRKSSISGGRIDVHVERDGQVVRQVNAELNLPNVLQTVFTTSQRDGGEVPFAVAQDGRVFVRSEGDRARVVGLGAVATPAGPATVRLPNWIVVTTADPSGSGVRLGIARPVGDSLAALRRAAARNLGFGLLFIAVALIGIVPISSRLTRHLTSLSDAAHRIAQGNYATRVPVKTTDEVGRLATAFNQMAGDVERHQRAAVEQERIKRELELGRQIQNEMLPHSPLKIGLTEIKGVSVPAREVGGDFFNYFEIGHGPPGAPKDVALLVGDVSGKGVGAALLMANIQASLRTRLALGQDLSALADQIDRDIEASSPGPVYATLFVGILNPATRRLRYVNAGHHPQYVLRKGRPLERMPSTGLPVGLLAGRGHAERSVQLDAGDVLFFYTDGCVEAENEQDDMFGSERLEALLVALAGGDRSDVLERVEAAISTFRGRREPFDDATMMAVRVG